MRTPWAGLGLGRPLRDAQTLQEAVQEAAFPRGAAPASFQAPAEACELRKRLTDTEPNTRFPRNT